MAQLGHADDCPACSYAELHAEDKAVLDPTAFAGHTRKDPPLPPPQPIRALLVVLLGFLFMLIGFSSHVMFLGEAGILIAFAAGIWASIEYLRWRAEWDKGALVHQQWKAEQTQLWLRARANAELWPCPSCGSLSCSNQHSTTTTVRTGRGRFASRTDPR